jgi:hypothetical protein
VADVEFIFNFLVVFWNVFLNTYLLMLIEQNVVSISS